MNEVTTKVDVSYRVHLDDRRRPTLPAALLFEAGIEANVHELVARSDGPGRVVLEDPLAQLMALQELVALETSARDATRDLALELIEERRADSSLD
jgi:hypothetical protein